MAFGRKRHHKTAMSSKCVLDRLVLQAKTAVLQEGVYIGNLSDWIKAAQTLADQAYYLATTPPEEIIQRWMERAELAFAVDGDSITITGLVPFVPKPKPLVWIQPGLFEE